MSNLNYLFADATNYYNFANGTAEKGRRLSISP